VGRIDRDGVVAERAGVAVHEVRDAAGLAEAARFLDTAETAARLPLVDEAERTRLDAGVAGSVPARAGWRVVVARRDGEVVGYGGVLSPHDPAGAAIGDAAVAPGEEVGGPARSALLAALAAVAGRDGAGSLEVWLRHAGAADVAAAADEGYALARRLGVLGRTLADVTAAPSPEGVTIRDYRPDRDDAGVVEVLAAAYAGTPDGGWTEARFRARRGYDWFRPEDLLVAEQADGRLAGLHWLKRRDATAGEVYNLALHPRGQGQGLGAALLTAGLAHLADVGLAEVILWVDLGNERAVRLYTSHGFTTRWEDVALVRGL
jgi:mycothiol synthase